MQLYELGSEPETAAAGKPLFGDDKALIRIGLIIGAVVFFWKLYIGIISNPIWEEGHFAVSGLYPALGYPDIPAGFPLLSRIVTAIFGWDLLPLRLLSLLIATAIPFAVYFMASGVVTKRQAIWAAILAVLIPPLSMSGTIYYPEGALQLLLALMLGCLLRALRDDSWKWWNLTGLCAALGLFIHFRFLIPGAGVVLFALLTAQGRKLWTNPKFWVTGLIAALGLVPSLIYNATSGWPAIAFHVTNRPDWRPDISFLMSFLNQQIGITTPIFFFALLYAGKKAVWDERKEPQALLGVVGLFIFGLYLVQSPANRILMPHWPFLAYVPLVALVPAVLINFVDKARPARRRLRQFVIALGPVLAIGVGLGITAYQWAWANSATIPAEWRALNFMRNENWAPVQTEVDKAKTIAEQRFGTNVALAVSGHVPATHLELPDAQQRLYYTLGEPYDTFSRFNTARQHWGLDIEALGRTHKGKGVVLILPEPSYLYHQPSEIAFYQELCRRFEAIEPHKTVNLPPDRTAVTLYTARVKSAPAASADCPLFPALYVAQPPRGTFLKPDSNTNYFGIATDPIGLTKVEILIDGKVASEARYGLDPEGARAPEVLKYDPNWPKVQFDFKIDQSGLSAGQHTLSIRATRTDGTTTEGASRTFYKR